MRQPFLYTRHVSHGKNLDTRGTKNRNTYVYNTVHTLSIPPFDFTLESFPTHTTLSTHNFTHAYSRCAVISQQTHSLSLEKTQ